MSMQTVCKNGSPPAGRCRRGSISQRGPGTAALLAAAVPAVAALCMTGCKTGNENPGPAGGETAVASATTTTGTQPATSNGGSASVTSTAAGGTGETINIGEYGSLTGDTADFGKDTHNGIELAVDRINAAGGELGKHLNVITKDDGSKADAASTVVEALLSQNVVAVLGEVASTRSLRGAPLCQTHKTPMISPSSTNPKVTEVGDYIFRVCFIDSFQGVAIGAIGTDVLHAKRAAVLFDNGQDYSKGLKDVIKQTFTQKGGQIVDERTFTTGQSDFNAQLTAIKAANPDVIFVPGYYSEVAKIARQARQLLIKAPLVGGDGWDSPQLTKTAGSALDNCYFTDHFSPDDKSPVVQEFVKKYQAKYGVAPGAMAALGYDSAGVLADAIKRAGALDGEALRNAIASTKNYQGVTGSISIGPDRNALKAAVVIKIVNGKFTFLKRLSPGT